MYMWRNNEALSKYNYCGAKAVSITYDERVCVALGIHHEMRMRRVVMCVLYSSTKFFHFFPH